jgi:Tol biopolymer transport system component
MKKLEIFGVLSFFTLLTFFAMKNSYAKEYEVYPVWSPDGTKIACTGYDSHKIYVIKIK